MDNTEPASLDAVPTDERKPKPAYSINQYTREYIGETVADPSQLEPGVWLLPAHAYYEKPPEAGAGEKAVMGDGGWELLEDFRGLMYKKSTGEPFKLEEFGPVPAELTDKPKPSSLHVWSPADSSWIVDVEAERAQQLSYARAERDRLLVYATLRINPLQDDVDTDEADDAGIALLKAWKKYRSSVNKVEDQAGWPAAPAWPTPPVPLETV